MDRQTDMTKLTVASRNFANAPKHLSGYSWRKTSLADELECDNRTDFLCAHEVSEGMHAAALLFLSWSIRFSCTVQNLSLSPVIVSMLLNKQNSVKWARWVLYHASYAANALGMGFFHEMRPKRKIVLNVHSSINKSHREDVQLRKHYSKNWEG